MLYQELLDSCKKRFEDFFKNTVIFENQFSWSDYNERLYELMFSTNSYDKFRTVKELKDSVPELKELCKKCGSFFLPQRNKSIPKYDVILGKQHEEAMMDFLSYKLKTTVIRADLENRSLPDCKVLKRDGSVAAYFEVKFHGAPFVSAINLTGRYCYEGSATLDYKKIEKQLKLIEEGLDAPVFYVHWLEYPCLKGVFFETSDQVAEYIKGQHEVFEREKRAGDDQKSSKSVYLKKMYSPLLKMKRFEDFLLVLSELMEE
ncbi:hypothetical protein [Paracholeplasma manati]|uniref:hypothetical protein n=1 Tax=Paracholeplasma manati TaxID=591373 RepID=UPI0024085FCC|nr:hypothetical protein [Paracholeplasma manati]MDG0889240.1 hypothetical protein [Paracholeplasma manati]